MLVCAKAEKTTRDHKDIILQHKILLLQLQTHLSFPSFKLDQHIL